MTLAKIEEFRALTTDIENTLDIIHENLGDDQITVGDLDLIKIPAGGAVRWEVPTLEGSESVMELDGIIVHWTSPRSYWKASIDEGGDTPPDCSSSDGKIGKGDPGGDCSACPMNEWGSGKNDAKACAEKRMLFLLRPNGLLPTVVQVPASSIKPLRAYLLRLANDSTAFHAVVTRFILEKAKSSTGITYARIVVSMASRVPEEQLPTLGAYIGVIKPLLARMPNREEHTAIEQDDSPVFEEEAQSVPSLGIDDLHAAIKKAKGITLRKVEDKCYAKWGHNDLNSLPAVKIEYFIDWVEAGGPVTITPEGAEAQSTMGV